MAAEGRGTRPSANPLAAPPPRATYRLQFHKDFTFDDAAAIVPYLARLGISHVYASPIHRARPGSTHGYDIVDHRAINPELGGEAAFYRLSDALRQHGLGLVLDIVPNHMGVGGADNPAWLSTFSNGASSRPTARAFDIDWERLGANRKLVVPFLGDRYGDALDKGELKLALDAAEGCVQRLALRAPVPDLPVELSPSSSTGRSPRSARSAPRLGSTFSPSSERLRVMSEETVPERRDRLSRGGRGAESPARRSRRPARRRLRMAIERAVNLVNGTPASRKASGRCTASSRRSPTGWPIGAWRRATSTIVASSTSTASPGCASRNPRSSRARTKSCSASSAKAGSTGLRIDHIDGLADPEGYVAALQRGGRVRGSTSWSRRSSSRAKRCGPGRSPAPPATTP